MDSLRGDTVNRRVADLAIVILALALLAPVFLLVALAIRFESRGPVLYAQERVGRAGRTFRMLKFRSMTADADRVGPSVGGPRDPRITKVGRFLRNTKLDELPQLWNVMKGEMTLIGPRAEVERFVRYYTAEELQLLNVRPGLTGPGQVHFTQSQAEALDQTDDPEAYYVEHQLHSKLALDLDYMRRRSLVTDIQVLASTMCTLVGRRRSAP